MSQGSASDEELLLILQGSSTKIKQSALDQLYARYAGKLLTYFLYSLHHDRELAADFVQDLFLKILEKPEQFDTRRVFKTWLFSVARNMCKNEYRRKGVETKHRDHVKASTSREADVIPDKDHQISRAINLLQDDYKNLIILRYKFKMSTKEIAEILDCPTGTVRSKLFYAVKELSKTIKQ